MAKGRDKRQRRAKKQAVRKTETLRKAEPLRGEPPPFEQPDARIYAPLKPRPNRGSGAVALVEPEEVAVEESIETLKRAGRGREPVTGDEL